MEKLLDLKNQLDAKLQNDIKFGLIGFGGFLAIEVIANFVFNAITAGMYWGFIMVLIWSANLIVNSICNVAHMYIVYFYTFKKPLISNVHKYIMFVAGVFLSILIGRVIFSIIYGWFGFEVITRSIFSYLGVTYTLNAITDFFDNLSWMFDGVADFAYQIYLLLCVVLNFRYVAFTAIVIISDIKPDLFAGLLPKKNPDFVDYSEKLEEKEITAEEIIETKIDENFAKDFEQETLDKGETPLSNQMQNMFLMTHTKYFSAEKMILVREKIENMSEEDFMMVSALEFKDPTTLLIVSIFLGGLGIDRFMLGDKGMGILKLLTGGCCGVMTIIDWFTISKKTKELNFQKFMQL